MKKIDLFVVLKKNYLYGDAGTVIKGYSAYSAPFHPTDDSKTYVLNGYAIGFKAKKEALKNGLIRKITKKEALSFFIAKLR